LLTHFKFFPILLTVLVLTTTIAPAQANTPTETGRLAFAAFRNGQWDIYSLAPDGSDPRQLTNDPFEETDPAYSPNGDKLAFASRRDNNWDIFVLDLLTGTETRLTSSPHYDGAPAWHPNGASLAYESWHNGDLDICRIDATGAEPAINLTADSEAGDFGPAWHPDGQTIAFSSWRTGNKDLFMLDVTSGEITQLTDSSTGEELQVWKPDGSQMAFVGNDLGDREIFTLDFPVSPTKDAAVQSVTWLGRTDGAAWNPDGESIAAIFHRWDGDVITMQTPGQKHQLPRQITPALHLQGRLTWHNNAVDYGQTVGALTGKFQAEQLTANDAPDGEPYNLIRLNDLEVGTPWLADTVDDSFLAWRFYLRDELGYDFLGTLSDATRDVASNSATSQYASWHKSGRAVDTLFDYHYDGQLFHEIVREDYSGETYWRIFLRCIDQTGECGRPITATPWNYSSRARTEIAPEQGGIEKEIPAGYYVDMTAIARQYGWERISSYDDEDYSWTWHFLAFEYWHYQNRNAVGSQPYFDDKRLNWYEAMNDVYDPETIARYFTWEKMRQEDDDPYLIALKGVPPPPEITPWWKMVKIGSR
jgi:TolB protein